MIFHDPDTLILWITLFFAFAAASVAFAFAALTVGVRELRSAAHARPVGRVQPLRTTHAPARSAA